jgi:hypothetical protein
MNYYEQPDKFQPSAVTIQKWLATKKKTTDFNNTTLPGYFNSDGNIQKSLIFIAAAIETIAFALTILGGYTKSITKHDNRFLYAGVIVAILFILLDLIGVYFYHLRDTKILLLKNTEVASNNANQIGLIRIALAKVNFPRIVAIVLLFLSAALKILALAVLMTMFKNPILASVVGLFYCFVIYIHASQTGWWIREIKFKRSVKRDYTKYLKTSNSTAVVNAAKSYTHSFQLKFQLSSLQAGVPKHVSNHQLLFLGKDSSGLYNYQINCLGLLWDEDIVTFCNGLLQQEKDILAVECLNLQLTQ